MPTIKLKPNSPDFVDKREKIQHVDDPHLCDYPGCRMSAEHKAPKNRDLTEYYNFCKQHAEEYNRAWDFFDGMSDTEIESHIIRSMHGDRPTWRYDTMARMEAVHRKAWQTYNFKSDEDMEREAEHDPRNVPEKKLPAEMEAMQILGLEAPVDLATIKTRYKQLAKRFHPDHNRDDPGAEEVLKRINYAYTVLKVAYQAYEKLPQRA